MRQRVGYFGAGSGILVLIVLGLGMLGFCERPSGFLTCTLGDFQAGRFHLLLLEPGFWSALPLLPGQGADLFNDGALVFAVSWVTGLYLLMIRARRRAVKTGLSCVAAAFLPFLLARLMLWQSADVGRALDFLAFSTLAFIYMQAAALGFLMYAAARSARPARPAAAPLLNPFPPMGRLVLVEAPRAGAAHPRRRLSV